MNDECLRVIILTNEKYCEKYNHNVCLYYVNKKRMFDIFGKKKKTNKKCNSP